MKIELEERDLRRIANMVVEQLRPILISPPAQVPSQGKADNENEAMIDIPSLCKYFGVSERWVRSRISEKTIPCYKMEGLWRFKKKEVERFLKTVQNI